MVFLWCKCSDRPGDCLTLFTDTAAILSPAIPNRSPEVDMSWKEKLFESDQARQKGQPHQMRPLGRNVWKVDSL